MRKTVILNKTSQRGMIPPKESSVLAQSEAAGYIGSIAELRDENRYPWDSSLAKRMAILKIHVATGMAFRGSAVPILKLMNKMMRILNADTPTRAEMNTIENKKSNLSRLSSLAWGCPCET